MLEIHGWEFQGKLPHESFSEADWLAVGFRSDWAFPKVSPTVAGTVKGLHQRGAYRANAPTNCFRQSRRIITPLITLLGPVSFFCEELPWDMASLWPLRPPPGSGTPRPRKGTLGGGNVLVETSAPSFCPPEEHP